MRVLGLVAISVLCGTLLPTAQSESAEALSPGAPEDHRMGRPQIQLLDTAMSTHAPASGDATFMGPVPFPACVVEDASLDDEESRMVELLNAYRQQNGRAPLALQGDLVRAATWMASDLAANARFGHTDSLGRGVSSRASACGYALAAGENIAGGQGWDTAEAVIGAWTGSTGHNSNMLSSLWSEVGVARVYVAGSRHGWYWALELGAGAPVGGTQ